MHLSNDEIDLSSMPQSYIEEMIALAQNNPYSSGGIRAAALLHQLYDAAGTKTTQVRLIGNSVCPEVAEALVRANCIHELPLSSAA